jgi:hypothetical protein
MARMKTKIGLGFLLILILAVSLKVIGSGTDTITIVAYYNQYACGDGNIDMKVQRVDDVTYKFIIDNDIAPVTNFFTQSALIGFVNEKTLMWQKGQAGEYLESFTLVGHLGETQTDTECSSPEEFVVDKIKYGKEKNYLEF